jgi:hypothetical protein
VIDLGVGTVTVLSPAKTTGEINATIRVTIIVNII